MAILNNVIVKGISRFIGNIYGNLFGKVNNKTINGDVLTDVPSNAVFTDTIDTTHLRNITLKAGSSGIVPNTIIMRTSNDTYESIVTSDNMGNNTTNKIANTADFYLDSIIYYNGNNLIENNNTTNQDFYSLKDLDFRYSSNCSNNLVAGKPLFLIGSINNNKTFKLNNDIWWTQELPLDGDISYNGNIYIYLGIAYNNTNIKLMEQHPIYYYLNGKIYYNNSPSTLYYFINDVDTVSLEEYNNLTSENKTASFYFITDV